jgi:hypothetical protein
MQSAELALWCIGAAGGRKGVYWSDMRIRIAVALALTASLTFVTKARAEVHLTISNGRVTLSAAGATVHEILIEWARVGQTKIVNGERIAGGPITLQLTNVLEEQALDVILRSVSGYVAAPRPIVSPGTSRFDRILIMPTSTPPRAVAATPQPPGFPQAPFPNQAQLPVDDDDPPQRNLVTPNPRGPVFNTFPQPLQPGGPNTPPQPGAAQPINPTAPQGTTGQPQMPVGVAVPGMILQPPSPQPGQPFQGQPPQPGQPFQLQPGQPNPQQQHDH